MRIKRKKKLSILSKILISIALLISVASVIYYGYMQKNISGTSNFNKLTIKNETAIRISPLENAPAIQSIPAGEVVFEKKVDGDWVEILSSTNTLGWIPLWDVVGNNTKSPQEKMKERLPEFRVILNVDENVNSKEYLNQVVQNLKTELEKNNIKVETDKAKLVEDVITGDNRNILINISMFENQDEPKGTSIYYKKDEDRVLAKYLEKYLINNYVYTVNKAKQTEGLIANVAANVRQSLLVVGNTTSSANNSVLEDERYKLQYTEAVKKGIEEYLYYILKTEEENKKVETLPTEAEIGLNIPFYYMTDENYRDIIFANNKKISEDGSLILSLAMIENYLNKDKSADVKTISDYLTGKYKLKQDEILSSFADKYSLKEEKIIGNQTSKIESLLNENKLVLLQLKSGGFNSKAEFVVVRGVKNNRFYINDPGDDLSKLNSQKSFSKEEFEKNILQSWVIYK